MSGETAMFGLSTLIVLLGGLSLVLQKVYKVDTATGEKTIIDVPFLGKLSTNYPAIAFVFIGAALASFTLKMTCESDDSWIISGSLRAPNGESVDWDQGNLRLSPKKFHMTVSPQGTFEIQGYIKKGHEFEEVVKQITYENFTCDGKIYGASIMVANEYNKFTNKENSLVEIVDSYSRRYKAIDVDLTQR